MKRAPEQNVGDMISLAACDLSLNVSIKIFANSVIHEVILLLTKLCTHIIEEIDSNSIVLASQPNMGFYIACFVMLQYLTLTFPCLTLVSRKFSIKKIQQQATMLLELMSTLSILSMVFPSLRTCLVAASLWIDILVLSH